MSNAITKKLHEVTIETMVEDQKLVSVKNSDSLEMAVKTLAEHKIHSAPVVNADGNVIGTIDMLDVVSWVVLVAPEESDLNLGDAKAVEATLAMAGRAMALKTVEDVMNTSAKNAYVPLEKDNKITLALSMFSSGIHRCPVVSAEGKLIGTFSQSAVIGWLAEQAESYLKEWAPLDKSLEALGMVAGEVVSVKSTDTVIKALKDVKDNGVSAVPVIDENGSVMGNFSAVDLRGMYSEHLPSFSLSIEEYLKKHSPKSLVSKTLSCEETTLRETIQFFKENPFHRVWLVNASGNPVGVVSHTDIMSFIATQVDA